MTLMFKHGGGGWGLVLSLACLATTPVFGQNGDDALTRAMTTSVKTNQAEAAVQQRIDDLSDETRAMLAAYHQLAQELDALKVYNDQLDRLVQSQHQEAASLEAQIAEIDVTRRDIVPLTLHLVEWLTRFVEHDAPFLPEERRQRTAQLNQLMDRADVTVAEKFRRVLEAYQIELEYGRTLEAYRGELHHNGQARTVDFLRLGRLGVFYQSLDRRESGHWDGLNGTWQTLPGGYSLAIREGLRIAGEQVAPALMRLPVVAPTVLTLTSHPQATLSIQLDSVANASKHTCSNSRLTPGCEQLGLTP